METDASCGLYRSRLCDGERGALAMQAIDADCYKKKESSENDCLFIIMKGEILETEFACNSFHGFSVIPMNSSKGNAKQRFALIDLAAIHLRSKRLCPSISLTLLTSTSAIFSFGRTLVTAIINRSAHRRRISIFVASYRRVLGAVFAWQSGHGYRRAISAGADSRQQLFQDATTVSFVVLSQFVPIRSCNMPATFHVRRVAKLWRVLP